MCLLKLACKESYSFRCFILLSYNLEGLVLNLPFSITDCQKLLNNESEVVKETRKKEWQLICMSFFIPVLLN